MRNGRQDSPDELDMSPRAVARRVRRAASGGPIPADPDERAAAYDLALEQQHVLERQRYWAPALFVLTALLAAGVAATGATWVWLTVPLWLALAIGHPILRAQARARAAVLGPGGPPA
ncbi:hypothetical protein [Blastococcus sp. CCUG 61487]|uniref:hypothetical protein n=1 Tax=Blastococcus sp. CCUG 61487 TaxID=1840703 RepID=UPI0010C042AB|nr:hypothetical protein [Blastococcus sp. CCUG 61487]TKJ22881.1 hypothetical protein A6V29_06175 [Blastococcus sp. CCUG 61487]